MRLYDMVCDEIKKIEQKGINSGNIEVLGKLVDIKKDLVTIEGMEEYDGYSNRGYDDGNSYARSGMHYVRGHYSRTGDYSRNGDYSRAGDYSEAADKMDRLERMMRDSGMAPDEVDRYMSKMR